MFGLITGKWGYIIAAPILVFLCIVNLFLLDASPGTGGAYDEWADYFMKICSGGSFSGFPLDWQSFFILGIMIGAAVAAIIAADWKLKIFPEDLGGGDFLKSSVITPIQGICGGFLVMLGIEIGGEPLLGLFCSAMELNSSTWVFLFFTLAGAFGGQMLFTKFTKKGGE